MAVEVLEPPRPPEEATMRTVVIVLAAMLVTLSLGETAWGQLFRFALSPLIPGAVSHAGVMK